MAESNEKSQITKWPSNRPPRTEAEARAQIDYLIRRDRKMLERLAKRGD
jgi:hypothetical protein